MGKDTDRFDRVMNRFRERRYDLGLIQELAKYTRSQIPRELFARANKNEYVSSRSWRARSTMDLIMRGTIGSLYYPLEYAAMKIAA